MIVVGLTGSIGMGKTATAQMFAKAGAPVFDADAVVHALYAKGGAAVARIAEAFPDAIVEGAVDRARLGAQVRGDGEAFARLEAIVHPLVAAARRRFLRRARRRGEPVAILDVPLLFETGGDRNVDHIIVVSAPEAVQRARVLARTGMTEANFAAIAARQTPDAEKRARADDIIDTSAGFDEAQRAVDGVMRRLRRRAKRVMERHARDRVRRRDDGA